MRFRAPGCKKCWRAGFINDDGLPHPSCDNPDPNHGGTWEEVTGLAGMGREAKPTTPVVSKKSAGDAFYAALRRYEKRGGSVIGNAPDCGSGI